MADEAKAWQAWIGRSESSEDRIDLTRARAMQRLLDRDEGLEAGDSLPPLWHWLYFWSLAPQADLGPDGHPARGSFLPPIALPRRMWAGSRLDFLQPLILGADVSRRSTLTAITDKQGRSGRLAFVTLRHQISMGDQPCIDEEQDIVYREAAGQAGESPPGEPAPSAATWQQEMIVDPPFLFRYSALTFNGHRIHYDIDYARAVEGYPGLVVHGPLLATLMVDLARRHLPRARVTAFSFRALRPIFDSAPFTLAGKLADDGCSAELWVADRQGFLAMAGRVELAP